MLILFLINVRNLVNLLLNFFFLSVPQNLVITRREYFNRWYSAKAHFLSSIFADIPVQVHVFLISCLGTRIRVLSRKGKRVEQKDHCIHITFQNNLPYSSFGKQ